MSRYAVQERYEHIKKDGQKKISNSSVLIVGVGALGSVASEQLVRAGIKELVLLDFDKVELSNLQRQSLFTEKDVGNAKVIVAKKRLNEINNNVKITIINKRFQEKTVLPKTDLILDCTDNIKTRLLLNDYALKNKTQLISGLAAGSEGMVFVTKKDGPCLRCFLSDKKDKKASDIGVLNTLTYTVASYQVSAALKIMLKQKMSPELIKFDLWNNEFHKIKIKPKRGCLCIKNA